MKNPGIEHAKWVRDRVVATLKKFKCLGCKTDLTELMAMAIITGENLRSRNTRKPVSSFGIFICPICDQRYDEWGYKFSGGY